MTTLRLLERTLSLEVAATLLAVPTEEAEEVEETEEDE
jgi:hypothetical protein